MSLLLYRHSKGHPIMTSAPGELGSGAKLAVGQSVTAPGGFTRLTLQVDGNLTLYARRADGEVVRWATATDGQTVTSCLMEMDGSLVLYNGLQPVWACGPLCPGARLVVQDDENLVIYLGKAPMWSSGTSLDDTPVKWSGQEVFHLLRGRRHLIPDAETLEEKFGGRGSVIELLDGELDLWPQGDPVRSVTEPTE
jgi:hypothetical protein